MAEKDSRGRIPFEHTLIEWIDYIHDAKRRNNLHKSDSSNSIGTHSLHSVVSTSIKSSRAALARAGKSLQKGSSHFNHLSHHFASEALESSTILGALDSNVTLSNKNSSENADGVSYTDNTAEEYCEHFTTNAKNNSTRKTNANQKPIDEKVRRFPLDTNIDPKTEFSLYMLSVVLDKLDESVEEEEKTSTQNFTWSSFS